MTGAVALQIWEAAVEPVRREGARARGGENGALGCYEATVDVLKAVYVHLFNRVGRRDGELAQIGWEFAAITDEVRKLGGEA